MVELKDFVRATLVQISEGVEEAKEAVKETGGLVNPATTHFIEEDKTFDRPIVQATKVEFDVRIETGSTETQKGAFGIFVGESGIGVKGDMGAESSKTNRVKFTIPLGLPYSEQENL